MNERMLSQMPVTRVISEPGDLTRYDYLVLKLGDDYVFMPYKSTITFPQRLNKWEVSDIKTIEDVEKFVEDTSFKHSHVEPYAILECINYINNSEQ